MSAEWESPIRRMDIHHEGEPVITAVALTNQQEMEEQGRLTDTDSDLSAERSRRGCRRVCGLQRGEQRIAITELLRSDDGWIYQETTTPSGAPADEQVRQEALILARAYRTPRQATPSAAQPNPLLPDPDGYEFADERIRQAAATGQQAAYTQYDTNDPQSRANMWAHCLEQAGVAAERAGRKAA